MRRIVADWLQPRSCSLELTMGATQRIDFEIFNLPAGMTVVSVAFSAKAAITDTDAARKIAKTVAVTPSAQGAITQAAGGATVTGYITILAANVPASFPASLLFDVWVTCNDAPASVRQVAEGVITIASPVLRSVVTA